MSSKGQLKKRAQNESLERDQKERSKEEHKGRYTQKEFKRRATTQKTK